MGTILPALTEHRVMHGRPVADWTRLDGAMREHGVGVEEIEKLLNDERTRRRAAAVLTIFDTALKGRSLGSLTSPGLVAKVVAENRDAIIEALR